ncbi:RNA methyltransferase [Bdellovibrio sp. HCB337]|uniref:RNA methyltransferase n=1 Tax=Bdellovibrio sp. HCB337 TaxID=3394358 RepID=UPI0039A56423
MQVDCKYKEKCAGCQYLDLSLKEQHQLKKKHLLDLLNQAQIPFNGVLELTSPAPAGLRDRVDLVFDRGSLGLYEKNTRQILDIEVCKQLSAPLQSWLTEVRNIKWPIQKGSLRLRVGPQGQRGLWLDFANIDIKNLLEEKAILSGLLEKAHVEIGQRHKVLTKVGEQLKLTDPEPHIWFQSRIYGKPVDLYCSVGSFTQTGFEANRALTAVIETWLNDVDAQHILEFGSGIGNLSFPALGKSRKLTACEIDRDALAGFEKSVEALSKQSGFENIRDRLQILQGDFQNRNPQNFGTFDTVLVNPPRSGLKDFLKPLIAETRKPQHFLYMSCFPESFVEDGKRLQEAGYQLKRLHIVDQFPQTTHYEVLSLWG